MSPLYAIIPITLLFMCLYGSYTMGRVVERARAKGIPILSKTFWWSNNSWPGGVF